jgi:serine/threonine protein kinase/tetratricopeptide (TPR) repeat protein
MATADKLIELFNEAKAKPAGAEQERFLAEACGNDSHFKEQVLSLLKAEADEGDSDFLKRTPLIRQTALVTEKPGDRIGRYKLLQQLGEGGCGVVYMAEQEEPVRRRVALKVIKLGMDTKSVIARFEAERQALALMDHPHIAKVFDAGATDTGRPFFVMELVRGIKITDYCDQNNLTTEQRLELFTQVCHAVQHAHQKGIIHRDLKPSNILVTLHDGVPVPKVIDFGVAKATSDQRLTDKTVFTAFEQFIGTPAYMSPEQAEMSGLDIDTRSDIYSLGVLLYELLTGQTPLDANDLLKSGMNEMRRKIREQEAARPSTRLSTMQAADLTTIAQHRQADPPKLIHLVHGDLDWIVMKCLEKDRTRRYETANDLAVDLKRHLGNEPVTARPPTRTYQFQKLVRRNKLAFAAAGAVSAALVIGLGASTWMFFKEKAARQRAVAAEKQQAYLREQAQKNERKAQTEGAKSQQVAAFLKDMLKGVAPKVALGRDTQLLHDILDNTAERVGKDLKGEPEVQAELFFTIGNTYLQLRDLAEAEAMHLEALRLRKSLFGETNELVAASLSDLARVLVNADKASEAEGMARQAVDIRRRLFGEQHKAVADSLYVLASALQRQRKLAEAETAHGEALAIRRALGDKTEVISSLNNLGLVLRDGGKKTEAEKVIREALAMAREIFGNDHPDTGVSLKNLASVLRDQGKLAEAERSARESVAAHKKVSGMFHPSTVSTLSLLLDILRREGKLDDALEVCRDLVTATKGEHGKPSAETATAHLETGKILLDQRKPAEAETVFRDSLEMNKSVFGDEHRQVSYSLYFIARALADQGKFDEAERLHREVLAMRLRLFGEANREVANAHHDLGILFARRGNLLEAEASHRAALEVMLKLADNNVPPDRFLLLHDVLLRQNKTSEARRVWPEALKVSNENTLNELARRLASNRDPQLRDGQMAALLAERAVALSGRTNAMILDTLAAAYAESGKFSEAIATQQEAIALPGDDKLKKKMEGHLDLYQRNLPPR